MIVAFRGVDEEFIASLPGGMIFESVTYVDISDDERPFSDVKIEIMEQFLRRTPNVTWLRIRQSLFPDFNVDSVIRLISSLTNLERLELSMQFSSVHHRRLIEFLLTSRQLPKLKHLNIVYMPKTWIVSALKVDIKPGFRQINMWKPYSHDKFMVRKRTMTIKHIEPRLVDTLNKFPRVKYIDVFTSNRQYRRQCQTDLETIRNHLPRHRSVTMRVYKAWRKG